VFAIIGTAILVGMTLGLALVGYAMYLTWDPEDDRERGRTSQQLTACVVSEASFLSR
jgi:hypothetical protein